MKGPGADHRTEKDWTARREVAPLGQSAQTQWSPVGSKQYGVPLQLCVCCDILHSIVGTSVMNLIII